MKHVLLIALMAIFFATVHAQNNYVEVTVSDTVLIKADYFAFRITITGDNGEYTPPDTTGMRADPTNYYRKNAEKQRQKQIDYAKAFEKKIKDAGFATEPLLLSDLAYRNSYANMITVSTHSTSALNALNELMKTEKGISCNLSQVNSSQEEMAMARLMQKLMVKAKAKATELAKLSGKKITTIISVSDKRSEFASAYQTNNITMIASIGIDRQSGSVDGINTIYPIQNSLLVRFAWQ